MGYEEGGALTEAVRRRPYQVVLFDEIEKAHPDVFNVLLQVLDDGRLTDGQGHTVDFKNTLIIMTSNIGSEYLANQKDDEVDEALKRLFTPEFRNRLDAIVQFKSLTPEVIKLVVLKFVMQLEAQLADRHVTIETSDEATDWLAKNGFDELYGARPLARVIQEHIKKPLADEILFGKLIKGGHVKVVLKDSKLAFEIEGDERERGAPVIESPAEEPEAVD